MASVLIPFHTCVSSGLDTKPGADGHAFVPLSGLTVLDGLRLDCRGYQSLRLEIENPASKPALAGIELCDKASLENGMREYWDSYGLQRAFLLGAGITHVVIDVTQPLTNRGDRALDISDIRQIELVMPEAQPGAEPLRVSRLRLSEGLDDTDDLAFAQPGDAIIRIKQLDIKCYTHCPEAYNVPEEVLALEESARAERARLTEVIRYAEINGMQTHYEHAALVAADVALARKGLAWHFGPEARRKNLTEAIQVMQARREKLEAFLSSRRHNDDEDDANTLGNKVLPVPDMKDIRVSGRHLVDKKGQPVLICSMSYHNEGELMRFYAPERHKLEIYAVGGGSRYDVEDSPVYEAFHQYENTARVGWQGWCGHLIKDQWSMGGLKENVVLCLENEHILDAIAAYNKQHAPEWMYDENLVYIILAYELSYMCMCDESARRFRLWLAEKHGGIAALNNCWGTAYASFDDIMPPATEAHAPEVDVNRAAWYDWSVWNARRFTDHLVWSKQNVRALSPDKPLCAGGTSSMLSASLSTSGIDEELIINEVDDIILHEGKDCLGIDLFQSFATTPKPMVDPEQGHFCDRWVLNYLHGKSAISMFWWPVQPSRQFPHSTMISPMHSDLPIEGVEEHLTIALDVRRLSREITAFWEQPKPVAILYSMTNMLQAEPALIAASDTPYLSALRKTYDTATCLDAGLTFVSERQLLAGKAKDFPVILAPCVRFLPRAVFAQLDAYVKAGGVLVLLGEPCLRDEYTRPADYLTAWGIESVASEIKVTFGGTAQRYDQNIERVVQLDSAVGGEPSSLLCRNIGKGKVWHMPQLPSAEALQALLDGILDEAAVSRLIRVTDGGGKRCPHFEARIVKCKKHDLIYLANLSDADMDFAVEYNGSYRHIRELFSLAYYPALRGRIRAQKVLLFRVD